MLRCIIESGSLIQNYVETDTELEDAEVIMPENDPALFEDESDEPIEDEPIEDEPIEDDPLTDAP